MGAAEVTDAGLLHLKGLAARTKARPGAHERRRCRARHLEGLRKLQNLDLSKTKVTNAGLVHLRGLAQLENLDLTADRQISDAGLTNLSGLVRLRSLRLGATNVGDGGIDRLKGLRSLRLLDVGQTNVTEAGVKAFRKAFPRTNVYWDAPKKH